MVKVFGQEVRRLSASNSWHMEGGGGGGGGVTQRREGRKGGTTGP